MATMAIAEVAAAPSIPDVTHHEGTSPDRA
jgi:hypothetical protein